jgi:FMN phosphatase YigB (HAD superfamily)
MGRVARVEFDFALVTTYETCAAKPADYREILNVVGVEARQALMVGDDWKATSCPRPVGLHTYWTLPTMTGDRR